MDNKTPLGLLLGAVNPLLRTDSKIKRVLCFNNYSEIEIVPSTKTSLTTRVSNNTIKKKPLITPYIKSRSQILRVREDLSDRNVINYKAAAFSSIKKMRIGSSVNVSDIDVKVGLIGSEGRIGQTAQAVGTAGLPGNMSSYRSPVRSRLYAAVTPGGGNNRHIPRPHGQHGYRCPAGFEMGGRFTDNRFSTCGAQLFDIPNILGRALRSAVTSIQSDNLENISQVIQGGTASDKLYAIQRMANIPRSGAVNPVKRRAAAEEAMRTITGSPSGEARLIRKDGVTLRPLVPSSVLRNFGGNKDMEDGFFIRSINRPDDIKGDDLALLAGPSIAGVYYVTSNGSIIGIERQRDLTVGERRKFGRQLNRAADSIDQYDVGNTVRDFASSTNGAFKYVERFPNVEKPLDYVEYTDNSGKKVQVRRWVFETFLKGGKRNQRGVSSRTSEVVRQITQDDADLNESPQSVAEAVKYLDNGGNPFDISSNLIADSLVRSKMFSSRKLGTGVTEYQDSKGKSIYQIPETTSNGSLAEKLYSDVFGFVGGSPQTVRLAGKPGSREVFIGEPTRSDIRGDSNIPYSKIDKGEMFRALVTDYLLDNRRRSPATLRPAVSGNTTTVIPSGNELSSLAGLTKTEIQRRFNIDLPEYLDNRGASMYKDELTDISVVQQQAITRMYDTMLERARAFKWDEYISRLKADGNLSEAETLHLSIVKDLFSERLDRLVKNKTAILRAFGIQ